jgi:hypothetical protein
MVDRRERCDQLCGDCSAAVTWESLAPDTRHAIDTAICRGPMHGLIAMRDAAPPIRLPHALNVLHYRYRLGVGSNTAGR